MSDAKSQTSLLEYCKYLEELILCRELNATEIAVATKIAKGYRPDWGYCCYSMEELAEWLEVTTRSICNAVSRLTELKFISVQRAPSRRNRYIPLFRQNEPGSCSGTPQTPANTKPSKPRVFLCSKPKSEPNHDNSCKSRTRKDVQLRDTKNISRLSIEEVSTDSLRESSDTSLQKTKDRNSSGASALSRRSCNNSFASDDRKNIDTWTSFSEYILRHWKIPKGWDEWAFARSVNQFTKLARMYNQARWQTIKLAELRLSNWLKRERYKTKDNYISRSLRGFEEWISPEKANLEGAAYS